MKMTFRLTWANDRIQARALPPGARAFDDPRWGPEIEIEITGHSRVELAGGRRENIYSGQVARTFGGWTANTVDTIYSGPPAPIPSVGQTVMIDSRELTILEILK